MRHIVSTLIQLATTEKPQALVSLHLVTLASHTPTTKQLEKLFDALEPHLWGDETKTSYSEVATCLQMSIAAIKVTTHRLRKRHLELLREEIAQTLAAGEDVSDELQHLRRAVAG